MIDAQPLRATLNTLKGLWEYVCAQTDESDARWNTLADAGLARTFVGAVSISVQSIRLYIAEAALVDETNSMDFRDLLREAYAYGIIRDFNPWVSYIEISRSADDKSTASAIPNFLQDVQFLLNAIEKDGIEIDYQSKE